MKKGATGFKAQLEDDVVTGRLAPGARLNEASLAARFGVSRTPVRETLRQLAAQGLVEIRPYRGAIVSSPDPKSLMEMFEVVAELEAMCGRLAARRLTDESEKELTDALQACAGAAENGDPDAYYYENERFHHAIYKASGNAFLEEQAVSLQKRLAPFRRLQLRVRNRIINSQREHDAIVRAIISSDPEGAANALRSHVIVQGERFTDLMASLNYKAKESV